MNKKKKNTKMFSPIRRVLYVLILAVVMVACFFFNLIQPFAGDSKNPVERINTHFEITLHTARDIHYRNVPYNLTRSRTLVSYSVPAHQVDASLSTSYHNCLLVEREANFMPDFNTFNNIDWWTPAEAINFEGATCLEEYPDIILIYHLLVEYTDDNRAIIYIQQETADPDN